LFRGKISAPAPTQRLGRKSKHIAEAQVMPFLNWGFKAWFRLSLVFWLAWATMAQASELADRLASPGYVLLMRHAYAPGVGDPPGYSLQNCESQRQLNDEGRAQAVQLGRWLRQQGVAQADVYSSPWCRCLQTAQRLGLGAPITEGSLGSFFDDREKADTQNQALKTLLAQRLPAKGGKALILVTHDVNIRAFSGQTVSSGEMVLAHVNPQGELLDVKIVTSP
jgi:phosphohistidine phosphatase SixA